MKSRQLLSVVFSLIMFTGVTAGSTAFAESDGLDDLLEDFCEMNSEQQDDLFSEYADIVECKEKLVSICDIVDEDDREDALEEFIDTIIDVADGDGYHSGGVYTYGDKDDDSNYTRDGTHEDLDDKLERYCEMTDYEKAEKMKRHHDLPDDLKDRLANYCDLSEDEQDEFRDSMMDRMDEFKDHAKYKKMDKSHIWIFMVAIQ